MIRHCLLLLCIGHIAFAFAHSHDDHGKAALQFHANKGQWPGKVLYRALTPGGAVFVENAAFTYTLRSGGEWAAHGSKDASIEPLRMHAFKVHFEGGSAKAHQGDHAFPHYVNYFLGNDESKWASGVPVFAEVKLNEVYPGIDLRVDGHNGMKYEWLVEAGADPRSIIMRYEGADRLHLEGGLLFIKTSAGDLVEQRPVAWQIIGEQKVPVECEFELKDDRVRFVLPDHDPAYPLVIDPVVVFSSYSGSTADNFGFTATYDQAGNLYGAGLVLGAGYPVTTGAIQPNFGGGFGCDMGISKFSSDGSTLIWSTYLGGSESEVPHSMVVNSAEELYVLGSSNSVDFPVTSGAFSTTFGGGITPNFSGTSYGFTYTGGSDIVVAHFNSTATALIGSTYVGGSGNDGLNQDLPTNWNYGDPFRGEIILDQQEDPLIATTTISTDLFTSPDAPQPTNGGMLDAYIFRMDQTLSTIPWATYYGGSGTDAGYGVQTSSTGQIYMTGGTSSTDLPMAGTPATGSFSGNVDGFIARFAADGSALLSTTYLGTSSYDQSYFVQLNTADEVFVVGQTNGAYPVTPGKYTNAGATQFIHKFSNDLSTSLWSTRIGGSGSENLSPSAFLVSNCGQIYFSGWGGTTQSAGSGGVISSTFGLPVTPDAYQSTTNGSDFYLMMLQPEAVDIGYATFFGGTAAEHVDGGTSRFDKNGIVYQAVCAGCQLLTYPTTPGVWSNTNNSFNCNLGVFKIDFEQAVQVAIQASATDLSVCLGEPIVFNAVGSANTWIWYLGNGEAPVEGQQVTHTYDSAGTYEIMLVGIDTASCNFADTAMVTMLVSPPVDIEPSFDIAPAATCQGFTVELTNTSNVGIIVTWEFGDGATGSGNSVTHFYQLPGEYEVTLNVIDPICGDTAMLMIPMVLDPPQIDLDMPSPVALCDGDAVTLSAGSGFTTYIWSTGQFTSSITVNQPGTYSVSVNDGLCTGSDTVQVVTQPMHAPAGDIAICPGMATEISPTFTTSQILWNTGDTTFAIAPIESGEYWFLAIDEYGCERRDTIMVTVATNGEGLAYIPNVFSPNGDLQNDHFQVSGLSLDQFSMEVYNRWGQLMYQTTNPANGWNGGVDNSGDKVPDGTYFYIITYKDLCSTEPVSTHHGHVTLVR